MWIFHRLLAPVRRFLERRRFPTLLLITAGLLLVNVAIPDPVPLIDELILLAGTVILASLGKHGRPPKDPDSGRRG